MWWYNREMHIWELKTLDGLVVVGAVTWELVRDFARQGRAEELNDMIEERFGKRLPDRAFIYD